MRDGKKIKHFERTTYRISETVREMANATINHYTSHMPF